MYIYRCTHTYIYTHIYTHIYRKREQVGLQRMLMLEAARERESNVQGELERQRRVHDQKAAAERFSKTGPGPRLVAVMPYICCVCVCVYIYIYGYLYLYLYRDR